MIIASGRRTIPGTTRRSRTPANIPKSITDESTHSGTELIMARVIKWSAHLVFSAFALSGSYPDIATAQQRLSCLCIAATTGCNFAVFDSAAGKPRKEWSQDFSPVPGKAPSTTDLALACWRKRDANPGGEGLCCDMQKDQRDAGRYYRGTLQ